MAVATSRLTAPTLGDQLGGHAQQQGFHGVRIGHAPPSKAALEPAIRVIRSAMPPPVHDSAVDRVAPAAIRASTTAVSRSTSSRSSEYRRAGQLAQVAAHLGQPGLPLGGGAAGEELDPDLGGRRQHRDVGPAEAVVGRGDALLEHRFGQAGDLDHRRVRCRFRLPSRASSQGSRWSRISASSSRGTPGKRKRVPPPARVETLAGRGAGRVVQQLGAVDQLGLAPVDLGHLAAEAGEAARACARPAPRRSRGRGRAPGGGRPGAVVGGRAEAAGDQHQQALARAGGRSRRRSRLRRRRPPPCRSARRRNVRAPG